MRIVFFGTPDFAVATLDALIQANHQVVAVVSAMDKMGGRGFKQIMRSDVSQYAIDNNIPLLQPPNLKSQKFLKQLSDFKADVQVVVAFRMLPITVWNMPPRGTYNLHGSFLPAYRGAAPINWAIINGEQYTGLTTFKLRHEIDTGTIALQEKIEIMPNDNFGSLYNRMKLIGATLMVRTMDMVRSGTITLIEQDDQIASHAPKIFHENCEIDFKRCSEQVHNFVRGLSPLPSAWFVISDKKIKLITTTFELVSDSVAPGSSISDGKNYWKIKCADGYIHLLELQEEGRKRMPIKDFLNGTKIITNNSVVTTRI